MGIDAHAELIERVVGLLPADAGRALGLSGSDVAGFVRRWYARVDPEDLAGRSERELAGAALGHLAFGAQRPPGHHLLRVFDPTTPVDGWRTGSSVIELVTDDRPFLVDSVGIVLARHDLGSDLLVHPVELVRRDAQGRLIGFGDGGRAEAWVHAQVAHRPPTLLDRLRIELADSIDDLVAIQSDAEAMRQRVMNAVERLRAVGEEEDAGLLEWMADGGFWFVGSAMTGAADLGTWRTRGVTPSVPAGPGPRVVLRKDRTRATVMRAAYLEHVTVDVPAPGGPPLTLRFVGLFADRVWRCSVFDVPFLAGRARAVIEASGLTPDSHAGRELLDTLEVFPRDELFAIPQGELQRIVMGITKLQERKQVKLFSRRDPSGAFVSCLVYVPRDRFSTAAVDKIISALMDAYGGVDEQHDTRVTGRILARVHALLQLRPDAPADVDDELVEARIARLTHWWIDDVEDELVARTGAAEAAELGLLAGTAFPDSYRQGVPPGIAVDDLLLARELNDARPVSARLRRSAASAPDEWRCTVMTRLGSVALSVLVPILEHLGARVVDEQPHVLTLPDGPVWIHDIGLAFGPGPEGPAGPQTAADPLTDAAVRLELEQLLVELLRGAADNDALNQLVVRAGLQAREIGVLRAYVHYLRQTALPFSLSYVEQTVVRHATLCAQLLRLFAVRFDPSTGASIRERDEAVAELTTAVSASLDRVASLDDDRILRALLGAVTATVRTNAYRRAAAPEAPCSDALALKLDPALVPNLPLPRPDHEIWVFGPLVEGIHLRGGAIARGGIRWSDRMEDFRTEVLGLMKAQMVKNAVIVPVGAKGGFVVRSLPSEAADRRTAVTGAYSSYIAALLDVTDNLVGGRPAAPAGVVRHDGDDTYLVVAADKGTATFSDTANAISARYGFWLGDAFASGGSAGYDHKDMGITARGAWESVRRHFRLIGIDPDRDPFTAVGIGDMSGDVFGNGMLLSASLRLVAAFDHRHVFIDPTPPPDAIGERRRLFGLASSSWADYDATLISRGGGVWPRTAKHIPVSPEAAAVLGLTADIGGLSPDALISAVLRAPVDLLWNGGIGTYVKASGERHTDVGDRSNDSVRVDGRDLRCRVVAEGGNLGFTQRGRIEYALGGGLVNTDAIDNSAGVDCSDHEVNIKILLDAVVTAGDLTVKQRNGLLEAMTDEVAGLVLADNHAQNLALAVARTQASAMADVHARQIRSMELAGQVDRAVEFLPDEQQLAERHATGRGLTVPEFAVLLAYTKDTTATAVLESDLPDDPHVADVLHRYFPAALRDRFPDAIGRHPLRREIVTTVLVNTTVNHAGLSYEHRMYEETSAPAAEIMRAHLAASSLLGMEDHWTRIDALGVAVGVDDQIELFLALRRLVERSSLWLLRHRRHPIDLNAAAQSYGPGLAQLSGCFSELTTGSFSEVLAAAAARRTALGVPPDLAARSAAWPYLHTAFDTVEVAAATGTPVRLAGAVTWALFERLELRWVWDRIGSLPRNNRWQTQARAALRDDLLGELRALAERVLRTDAPVANPGPAPGTGQDGRSDPAEVRDAAAALVTRWLGDQEAGVRRTASVLAEIAANGEFDLSTLTVALRQLRNLAAPVSG